MYSYKGETKMDLQIRNEVLDLLKDVCITPGNEDILTRATELKDKIFQDAVYVRGLYIPKARMDQWIKSINMPKHLRTGVISPRIKAIKEARIAYDLSLEEAKDLIDEIINEDY